MTTELPKAYEPKSVEQPIYDLWQQAGAFNADPASEAPKYCIVIPPPNVTAALHLGHALNNTLQDVLIRWRRMQQFSTLWMPGTDHAGIATQTVVEKRILAEEGKRRTDFERAEFVGRIQAWKDEYEARILNQLKTMGCSCDWRRTRFTMDETCAQAVRANFFKLFSDGLIYRGKRLVNWDPATQTVLADDEVEHESVNGHFWYLRYPLVESVVIDGVRVEHVTVATTRPETMLGDTAVAMHPADPRAKFLVGKSVRLPIVGRVIPIIADEHVVLPDPESADEKARFSTGFLKVTPAHDPNDWEIGKRHDLPVINVMAPDGTISDRHGWSDWDAVKNPDAESVIGMDRFEAREAIVEFFRKENLLENVKDYVHEVGHSYRSHVPIEPYLSDQWYVAVKKPIPGVEKAMSNCKLKDDQVERRGDVEYIKNTDVPVDSLAGLALMPLLDGRLKFTPDRYANNYRAWIENLRDWPISRQLWWGHQIPVWSKTYSYKDHSELLSGLVEAMEAGVISGTKDDKIAHIRMCDGQPCPPICYPENIITTYFCVAPGNADIEQLLERNEWTRDTDVLDTWFSSALWPFSTLGWPNETPELAKYYPGDVLCTAREIITLWVSRMVMMGQYCVGDIPFSDVFIHAMIQDGEGRKMSKSLGNGIDPLDIIDSHGADAMRFTLVSMTTQTQDVRMPVKKMKLPDGREVNSSEKFDMGRNFCNKLWNASRFAMMNIGGYPLWDEIRPTEHVADAWILSRLNTTIRDVTRSLEAFAFNEIASTLYHFAWDDFCDWYLEVAKGRIQAGNAAPKAIVAHVLDTLLRMLHPVTPFITEEIWQKLGAIAPVRGPGNRAAEPLLIQAAWPQADAAAIRPTVEQDFATLQSIVREIRNVRTQHNVIPSRKVDVTIDAAGNAARLIETNRDLVASLAGLANMTFAQAAAAPADAAAVTIGDVKVYVTGIVDRKAEQARLEKQRATLQAGIRGIEGKLGNEGFLKKAPADLVEREKARMAGLQAELDGVEKALAALK